MVLTFLVGCNEVVVMNTLAAASFFMGRLQLMQPYSVPWDSIFVWTSRYGWGGRTALPLKLSTVVLILPGWSKVFLVMNALWSLHFIFVLEAPEAAQI